MTSLISNKTDDIIKLCKKYDIKFMYLFGSSATGKITKSSDIDILIAFKDNPH